jgi:O-antigen/teichoic acid export membrane protein
VSSDDAVRRSENYSGRSFLRRSATVAAIRIAGLFLVFALQVIIARLVDDGEQYGKYAWGQSLMFLAGSLACLGVPVIASRFIASLRAQSNEHGIAMVVSAANGLLLRSAAVLLLLALLVNFFWQGAIGEKNYRQLVTLALLLAPAIIFTYLYLDYCRARQWLALALLPFNIFRPLMTGILVYAFWLIYEGELSGEFVMSLAGASMLMVLLPQVMIYHWRSRSLARLPSPPSVPADYHPSQLFRTALPVSVVRCASLTIHYSNVLLVGFLAGPTAAGAYFAAERLAQLASIPQSVVSSVNQQSMAAAHATKNMVGLQKITTLSAHGSLWPTLVIGFGLTMLATPLLHLFGDDFSTARAALIALVISNVIGVFMGPAQEVLFMTGRQGLVPRIMIFCAAVHLTALCLLVPTLGALGAALSSVISGLIGTVWLMIVAQREAGIGTTVLGSLGK